MLTYRSRFLYITISLFLLVTTGGDALQYDCDRDFPLFDYRAEGNRLPLGDYVMIRSFRETTQIIISRNHCQVTIYTDRNNLREGDIAATSWSGLDMVVSHPEIPTQLEFDRMLRDYALNGLSAGDKVMFRGVSYYLDKIGSANTTIDRYAEEYVMRIDEEGALTEITVDARWKKLVIKKLRGDPEASRCPSVYIDQTLDKTLRRIITGFAYRIRETGKK